MKATIDFKNKTIKVNEPVDLNELFDILKNQLNIQGEELSKWKLIPWNDSNNPWVNPLDIVKIPPYTTDSPIIPPFTPTVQPLDIFDIFEKNKKYICDTIPYDVTGNPPYTIIYPTNTCHQN